MLVVPQRVVSLWDMLTYLTGNSFAALGNLGQSSTMLCAAESDPSTDSTGLKQSFYETLVMSVAEVERIATELNLDATLASVGVCKDHLSRITTFPGGVRMARSDVERLGWLLHNLKTNFSAQMNSRLVMVLGYQNASYLISDDPPFGKAVDDAFPKASEEISEAAKCLALKRNTAAVFHLMRAMELAVQRLAEALGRANPNEKVWGVILAEIHSAIESMPKGAARDAWSASHAHLYHVKQAWRNDTMHPKSTYTEEQAQTVFDAVKSFMSHLAPLV